MKKALTLLLSVLMSLSVSAQWQRPSTPNDNLQSAVVLPGGDVVLSIYAPNAQSVMVAGDIVPWGRAPKFEKAENGVWSATLTGVKEGVYRYHFIVDGVRVYDPKAPEAGETSALVSVGSADSFFAMKDVPHGAVAKRWYNSRTLGTVRRLHVWTPAGYEKGAQELPVLYLVHGGGDTDNAWPGVGAAGFILDNLLAEGKIEPMVVVMPNGSIATTTMEGEVPLFEKDLMTDIVPFIEANYRVKADKDHRALAGLSMGGMETLETLLEAPDQFAYFWVLSSGWIYNENTYPQYAKRLEAVAPVIAKSVKQLVFTQGGKTDIAYNNCQKTLELFDAAGIKYEKYLNLEGEDGHSWGTWRRDLHDLAQRIFR